jgi:WD40 repeat protein
MWENGFAMPPILKLLVHCTLASFLWLGWWKSAPGAGQGPGSSPKAGTDLYGDTLPAHALVRFGTTRLRHAGEVLCLTFAPTGQLVSAGADGVLHFWDPQTGRALRQFGRPRGAAAPDAIAFSSDGKLLAVARGAGIAIWEMPGGRLLRTFQGSDSVVALAFVPGSALLAAAIPSGRVIPLWDATTGKLRRSLPSGEEAVRCLAISADGAYLASGHEQGGLRLWDLRAGKELVRLTSDHTMFWVAAVCFSPDGQSLAAATDDYDVLLWDLHLRKLPRRFKGHQAPVSALAFAADGQQLASGGRDGTVRL